LHSIRNQYFVRLARFAAKIMAPIPIGQSKMEAKLEVADLADHRNYLALIARPLLGRELAEKQDLSDVVHDTMVDAIEKFGSFRGTCQAELAAWLGTILAHNVADKYRAQHRQKRDVRLERSIEAVLGESSSRLKGLLAADQTTPSEQFVMADNLARLANAVAALPDEQREAVTLHHLHAQKLTDVAQVMGKTVPAVAGLIRRGVQALRQSLEKDE
jgi:RNA polymerase sigma-70 factor (ECF subfamily)